MGAADRAWIWFDGFRDVSATREIQSSSSGRARSRMSPRQIEALDPVVEVVGIGLP